MVSISMKDERSEESVEDFGASRGYLMRFKERNFLHIRKVQVKLPVLKSFSKLSRRCS